MTRLLPPSLLTSLPPGVRIGSQEPRLKHVPAYEVSYGLEAVEFNAEIGHPLDPWQALLMLDACGVRSDKLWAAFEILLLMARQNGKGGFTEGIELAKLFLFKEPLILHSAHQFKALDVSTPIFTSRGWSTMGALEDGDEVFAPDGQLTKVVAAHPWRSGRPCFRLRFDDGQEIVADADHLWEVTEAGVGRRVLTTQQIADAGVAVVEHRTGRNRRTYRFRVDIPCPLAGHGGELPIHPWLLGAWLGDGTSTKGELTAGAKDLPYLLSRLDELGEIYRVRPDGRWPDRVFTVIVRGLAMRLRSVGVLGAKHIPGAYLLAGQEQRRQLLAGIMDTDGTVGENQIAVTMVHARLMDDVASLVRSLGYKASLQVFRARLNGRDAGPMYRVQMSSSQAVSPFGMPRKTARVKARHPSITRAHYNAIVAIDPVASRPTRCITVAHESSLYLVGRGFIATHNTSTAAFRRLIDIIDGSDWLTKRVKMVSRSKGDESIELTRAAGGGRLQFIARTLGSGRGLTGSTTVIDEAAYLTIGQYAAQTPALSTIPNPQIIYTGTPPDDDVGPMPEDAMLPSVRKRAKAGDSRVLYAEWSPAKDDDPESEDTMYACNPAAGFRIGLWFLKQQLNNFKAAGRREKFVTEHLGAWPDDADEQWKVVTEQDWTDAGEEGSRAEGGVAIGISMARDRSTVYIGYCGLREDGKRHLGLKQMLYGSDGVVEAVQLLKADPVKSVCAVVIGANDPARSLLPDFKAAGIHVITPGTADVAAECGAVYDALRETAESPRDMFHNGQGPLTKAMAAAGKKVVANSWVWAEGTVSPAPLFAVTNASYGFRVCPPSDYDIADSVL